MIKAECHSDDRAVEVAFDATPWFAQAEDGAILKLAACDWGGDYPADDVAMFMAGNVAEIATMFLYIDARQKIEDCGFECHVDPDSAIHWITINRPALHQEILAREIGV